MAQKKQNPLFKSEVKRIETIRNSLKYHQKINGTQVILHGLNKEAMKVVIEQLDKALLLLNAIK